MEDSTGRAIPIRRSRAGARPVIVKTPGLTGGVAAAARRVLASPRQVWLATLGGAGLTARGAVALWARLILEGEEIENRLRRSFER